MVSRRSFLKFLGVAAAAPSLPLPAIAPALPAPTWTIAARRVVASSNLRVVKTWVVDEVLTADMLNATLDSIDHAPLRGA